MPATQISAQVLDSQLCARHPNAVRWPRGTPRHHTHTRCILGRWCAGPPGTPSSTHLRARGSWISPRRGCQPTPPGHGAHRPMRSRPLSPPPPWSLPATAAAALWGWGRRGAKPWLRACGAAPPCHQPEQAYGRACVLATGPSRDRGAGSSPLPAASRPTQQLCKQRSKRVWLAHVCQGRLARAGEPLR